MHSGGINLGSTHGGGDALIARRPLEDDAEFDITAMIDLVFMMNIYFLVSFLTAAAGEIAMPTARHVAALDPDTSVRITVLGSLDGESVSVYLGNGKEGEEIKDPEQQEIKVREYVEKALAEGKTNVLIKAEAKVQEGQVNRISLAAAIEGMKLHSGVTEIDEP
jgi:biopolymer transport protein ExbD